MARRRSRKLGRRGRQFLIKAAHLVVVLSLSTGTLALLPAPKASAATLPAVSQSSNSYGNCSPAWGPLS
jgi:hypothetical protein